MEKLGLYNRQGILLRKDKRIVNKNHTYQPVQEVSEKFATEFKKDRITSKKTNGFKKVCHTDVELQLKMKDRVKQEEKKKTQMEDREMLMHLKRQLERDAFANAQKKQQLAKIAQENKKTAVFKTNVNLLTRTEDTAVDNKAALKHDYGYTTSF
mmetsp:Transcript_3414/g.4207  ORF Transcript_3414/g.4207 Transcript_3414/m.4207 type:complete len:154 (-) Transcript_3414:50-511(-)